VGLIRLDFWATAKIAFFQTWNRFGKPLRSCGLRLRFQSLRDRLVEVKVDLLQLLEVFFNGLSPYVGRDPPLELILPIRWPLLDLDVDLLTFYGFAEARREAYRFTLFLRFPSRLQYLNRQLRRVVSAHGR